MDAISGWFAGKAAEKEMNSAGESLAAMADDAANTVTNWWDSMMGKTQKPLGEFLEALNLPGGVLPKNITKYKFEPVEGQQETGKLTVNCPFTMEVKFSDGTIIQYKKVVEAKVSKGKLEDLVGVKLSGMMGSEVKAISAEGDKVVLQARMKSKKPASLFKRPLEGVEVVQIK